MLHPLFKLLERAFVVNGVDTDSDFGITQEEVGQIVDLGIARRVPNIELQAMLFALAVLHVVNSLGVLDHCRPLHILVPLGGPLQEAVNDRGLAHGGVAHHHHLRRLDIVRVLRRLEELFLL